MPLLRGPINARPPAGAAPRSGGRRRKRAGLELLLRNPLFFLIFAVRVSQKFCRATEIKESAGYLQIFERKFASDIVGWTAEHEIQTENEAFNQRFRVFAADEHNAFYILTPRMLEQITQFANQVNAQIAISFCGSSMFVAIDRLYSILDASFHVPVSKQTQMILNDVELLRQAGELLILEVSAFHKKQG